jgi:ribose transport system substrate-binding protein
VAWATIAQDTWSMGFWSLMSMYTWKHSLLSPMTAWKSGGFAPLPQYIQTGVALVTKQNTQEFLMRPKKAADSWVK